jgi:alkylation response protein AidB-like acyl-CoA dehydrogenase
VNFAFTEDQDSLRDVVRSFMDAKSTEEDVRTLMDTESGYDAAVWAQMGGELGLQGLHIPEEFGGQGYSFVELGIVFEEMGRRLLCAPYFATVALAANAVTPSVRSPSPRRTVAGTPTASR